jgi:hypothetical protein
MTKVAPAEKNVSPPPAVTVEKINIVKTLVLRKNILPALAVVAVLAIAAVPSYYFYQQYKHAQMLLNNPNAVATQELNDVIAKVGKLMMLPKEQPTVATVTDKNKLKKQSFFAVAENGDKVLIYTGRKQAILYRPSTNKIVQVAPISIADDASATASGNVAGASTAAPSPTPVKVAIYNGTITSGLATQYESDLKSKIQNVNVVTKTNAKNRDYTKTIVVDISGNHQKEAKQLADVLKAEVGQLPVGEVKPNADFLIILGK